MLILIGFPARGGFASSSLASESSALALRDHARVNGAGIYLVDLVDGNVNSSLSHTRVADSPLLGETIALTRAQIYDELIKYIPELMESNLTGSAVVKISRRVRTLTSTELNHMISYVLQTNYVRDRGALEIQFTKPWSEIPVPDEPLQLKILELPTAGVTPNFIIRFQLLTNHEVVGTWQLPMQASVWAEVWVARSPLRRGEPLPEADLIKEPRDMLAMRSAIWDESISDPSYEIAENISVGKPLYVSSVQPRTLMKRGQRAEALLKDGPLTVSLKVEVLQDGVLGQTIRVRNSLSKKEFQGKVQSAQTVVIHL